MPSCRTISVAVAPENGRLQPEKCREAVSTCAPSPAPRHGYRGHASGRDDPFRFPSHIKRPVHQNFARLKMCPPEAPEGAQVPPAKLGQRGSVRPPECGGEGEGDLGPPADAASFRQINAALRFSGPWPHLSGPSTHFPEQSRGHKLLRQTDVRSGTMRNATPARQEPSRIA